MYFQTAACVKSSGTSQTTAREDVCHSHSFRDTFLFICQTRIWKKFHHAKVFPGIRCAAALHCPRLSRCTGLVVSISCESACKYLALLKITHQVPVLQCSCPCSTPGVCWWIKGSLGMCADEKGEKKKKKTKQWKGCSSNSNTGMQSKWL